MIGCFREEHHFAVNRKVAMQNNGVDDGQVLINVGYIGELLFDR